MASKVSNIELKDLVELHLSTIREEIKSLKVMSEYKFNEIIGHQKVTNGRVNALEEGLDKIVVCHDKDMVELKQRIKLVEWVDKNKKLLIIYGITLWFVLDVISKSIELVDILKLAK
jgi:hypothetical protein